jgi:ring-1,2-phenylacetyl-CoA epoxidase subunit PaaE
MGLFKIFKKKSESKAPKGYQAVKIKSLRRLTKHSVQVTLDIPADQRAMFNFTPGQYIDFDVEVEGTHHRRSYSICSGQNEEISVAIKAMPKGTVSKWFNETAKEGAYIFCSTPKGSFIWEKSHENVVAFAAGSGITPILSIAKKVSEQGGQMTVFYGNKTLQSTIFKDDLDALPGVTTHYFFSSEVVEGHHSGRLTEEAISTQIKEKLDLLKADAFFLCGPIEMIKTAQAKLILFGVDEQKIKRELFSAPVEKIKVEVTEGENEPVESNVSVFLDGENIKLKYKPKGKSILELLDADGYDPPYSCRGGVCSTCKARVTEGAAKMKLNYVLTDQEVADGFILCCQAQPTTENISIVFDV